MQGQVLLCPLKNAVVVYDSAMQKTPRGNHNRANIIDFTLGYVVAQFTNTTGHQNSDFFSPENADAFFQFSLGLPKTDVQELYSDPREFDRKEIGASL